MQADLREAGLTKASVYPMCATGGCPCRARGRVPGSLCLSCRRAAGDTTVICEAEGCTSLRARRGLCNACFTTGDGVSRPPRRAAKPRLRCERPGCHLKPHDHHSFCGKHRVNWNACIIKGCAQPITENNKCARHKPGEQGMCSVQRCSSPRFKAGLCYHHHGKFNPQRCARPGCDSATTDTYCQPHNVGVDFAAGDWHDWVAVEQLWEGRLDPGRMPTVPELNELFDMADRAGIGGGTLAAQVRVDERRLRCWRDLLGRIERQGADIAAAA